MRLPVESAFSASPKSAKFPEGKEMSAEDMAEYLAKGGNPEAGKEWKENHEEHKDVVKDKNKEAFQRLPLERKMASVKEDRKLTREAIKVNPHWRVDRHEGEDDIVYELELFDTEGEGDAVQWFQQYDDMRPGTAEKELMSFLRHNRKASRVAFGPGKKITVEELEEIGGNMLEGDEDLEALARQLNSAGGARRVEKAMRDADKILGTHGVEAVFEEGDYDGDPAMTYLNTGDTYAMTLVYDVGEDELYVSTWGDWVEWAERKGRQMRASAKKTAVSSTDDDDSALRALGEGPRPLKDVAQALGWLAHGPGGIHATEELLGLLAKKGLVSERSGKWSLTSKGERAFEKVRIRRSASLASKKTACGANCACGGSCMNKCQTKTQEPGTLVWASELEAEKLEAEAQAAEAQAEADRQKAEAAQLREASDLLPVETRGAKQAASLEEGSEEYFGQMVRPLITKAMMTRALKPHGFAPRGKGSFDRKRNRVSLIIDPLEGRGMPIEVGMMGSHYTPNDGMWDIFGKSSHGTMEDRGEFTGDPKRDAKAILDGLAGLMADQAYYDKKWGNKGASTLLPIERMKLGEKYPWDECIADQMERYGDKETAEKVCGAIRAKSQFGKGAKQELPEELKEHQFTSEDNPNPKGSDKDGDGETNEPSPIKEASVPSTVSGWLAWQEKSA